MEQMAGKSQEDAGEVPRSAGYVWHCRTNAVDFLKTQGGPFGVMLVLDSHNVEELIRALQNRLDMAKKLGTDKVQINAHWGNQRKDKGFKLDVKVQQPKKQD